jgi:cell division protein FtsB
MKPEAEGSAPRRLNAVPTQRQNAASGPSRSSGDGDGRGPGKKRTRYTARAAILMLVLCAMVLALAYPLQQYFSQGSQIDQLKQQNAEKRAEVEQLRQELARWQDPDYVKIQARLRLHYVVPGETGLRLLGAGDAAAGGQGGTGGPSEGSSAWYSQLWDSVTSAASGSAPAPASSAPSSGSPTPTAAPTPTPATGR